VLCVIPVFPSMCMGRKEGWSVCLCCCNPREFTFALWSSVKGVHGEVGVGCRVSWGCLEVPRRVPFLGSEGRGFLEPLKSARR
jgi:hypothetical protein